MSKNIIIVILSILLTIAIFLIIHYEQKASWFYVYNEILKERIDYLGVQYFGKDKSGNNNDLEINSMLTSPTIIESTGGAVNILSE